MILSGTAGLGKDMKEDGIETYERMFNREKYEKNLKAARKFRFLFLFHSSGSWLERS